MKPIIQFIFIIFIGAGIILGTASLAKIIKKSTIVEKEVTKSVVIKPPTCGTTFVDYQKIVTSGQYIKLASNLHSYANKGSFTNNTIINVERSGQGELACGYLYVKVRVNGRALDNNYESIYINPNEFGGHILRTKSIDMPAEVSKNVTVILLPLNSISYLPNLPYNPNSQNYRIADWVKMLNVSNKVKFQIGLSALDERGMIDEVGIAYKCWNSETGEELQNCQLSLE